MITQEIKDVISTISKNLPSDIGVGYGYKKVNGVNTNEESIVFYVRKKLPLSELLQEEILPETFILSNKIIKTDVVEVDVFNFEKSEGEIELPDIYELGVNSFCWKFGSSYSENGYFYFTISNNTLTIHLNLIPYAPDIPEGIGIFLGSINSSYNLIIYDEQNDIYLSDYSVISLIGSSDNNKSYDYRVELLNGEGLFTTENTYCILFYNKSIVNENRSFHRPIMGGLSISAAGKKCYLGTLGIVCIDKKTQALVGISTCLVLNVHHYIATDRLNNDPPINDYNLNDGGSLVPNTVYQPGELLAPLPVRRIGEVLRYVPLYKSGGTMTNKVYVGLLSLDYSCVTYEESYKQFGLGYDSIIPFATTEELDNILATNPVLYTSGRDGVMKGGGCARYVISPYASLPVIDNPFNRTILFEEVITFSSPEIWPGPCGSGVSSGAALIADFGGTYKIIGIIFAFGGQLTVACRIDNIVKELDIEEWDGSVKPFVDLDTKKIITVDGLSPDITLDCNNETYWQVGTTSTSQECN